MPVFGYLDSDRRIEWMFCADELSVHANEDLGYMQCVGGYVLTTGRRIRIGVDVYTSEIDR